MGFYDNEVKRLCENCPRLLIIAVNSIFKKNHDINGKVAFLNREINSELPDNPQFMDELIDIDDSKYHFEFQLLEGRMAVRMYEYAVRETIRSIPDDADRYEIDVVMPHQAVIFLAGANKRNEIRVNLTLPDDQKVSYMIRCISASETIDYLCEEGLYILLPFQQVQLNDRMNRLSETGSTDTRKKLAKEIYTYGSAVINRLEKLVKCGIIYESEKESLIETMLNVELYIRLKDNDVDKEVRSMGDEGYIAWSDKVRQEAREEARKEVRKEVKEEARREAREEAKEEAIRVLILDNLEDGKTNDQIIFKLKKRFGLTEEKSKEYLERYSMAV